MERKVGLVFKSGASRSQRALRYDLIPREALERWARRMTAGAAKHGEENWKLGAADPEFIQETKNHLMAHVLDYLQNGCKDRDNLAAILCNAGFLAYFEGQTEPNSTAKPDALVDVDFIRGTPCV